MKTTNAKANAFQTPAPPNIDPSPTKTQQKNRSPRLKRAKVKIHQTDEDLLGESEDRDIEIMPQREIRECPNVPALKPLANVAQLALPDHPEWYSPDLNLDLLQGQSLSRGIWSAINNPVGEDGLTKYEREDAIAKAESDKATDELLKNAIDGCFHDIDAEFAPSPAKETLLDAKPKPATTSTLASKSAASALYRPVHAVPSFALPTANSKAKLPNARPASRKQLSMQRSSAAAPRPHQAAALASRSTIGYSKGRTAPSSVRKPLTGVRSPRAETSLSRGSSQMTITPELFTSTNSNLKNEGFTEEEALRKLQAFSMENDFPESSESERLMFGDDAFDDFQLEVPEL